MQAAPRAPLREVHHADALEWLRALGGPLPGASYVTSLPDVCELPALSFTNWRAFFEDAAAAVLGATPDDGVAVFFQSDIRRDGRHVDKGYLVMHAAEREGSALLFHKIVCRRPPG